MTQVALNITLLDLAKLKGYVEEKTKGPYETKRLRNKDHLLILYTTGKLVIQGKKNPFVNKEKTKSSFQTTQFLSECIGSDETLKGDTFGGLIVCGAYFTQEEISVADSKTYKDYQIIEIAKTLLEKYPTRFSSKILTPKLYNELYAKLGSQTAILNNLHQAVGLELKQKFSITHVVDKYPGCIVGDVREEKAESKYVAVAAASVVARYYALQQFNELSKKATFRIPKGSTHVKEALLELKKRKLPVDEFAKIHFSTVKNL